MKDEEVQNQLDIIARWLVDLRDYLVVFDICNVDCVWRGCVQLC